MQIQGSTFTYGQLGIQRGLAQLDQAGAQIAQGSVSDSSASSDNGLSNDQGSASVEDGLLSLPEAKVLVQAGAKVLEAQNSTLGTLLDIKV
ncbi:hypothetical protein WH50_06800 [Pokkaliibacter plantistimulans]|uniref:Flagellar basal-body/hook protein C-terminal domain-containing protein n=2 Tax=Pseudomonadota TaxID=1224 RepID=A0ABX5M2Y4_9GAMM|nr:hypothetical protein [Pokkaliibacter plantistimulans]PPC74384.1 hypothetical protein C4K68_25945 [Pokkaliibacter plantistimulans]PXF32028.1 hypothetical protein WH50_06800 [Pokkaliibacter plantistimulans]